MQFQTAIRKCAAHVVDCLPHQLNQIQSLWTNVDFPAGNPRDFQEVIDQMGHLRGLSFDDLEHLASILVRRVDQHQHLNRTVDA